MNKKGIIICSYLEGTIKDALSFKNLDCTNSLLVCADGGIRLCKKEGIIPDILLGDFDSLGDNIKKFKSLYPSLEVITIPKEKDDTDTAVCINYCIKRGINEIYIIGGMGGRVDHTIAIVQKLAFYASKGIFIYLINKNNIVFVSKKNEIKLKKGKEKYFSIFSFDNVIDDLSISGVKYPLDSYKLRNTDPIGISNEIVDDCAIIKKSNGLLLIILSID